MKLRAHAVLLATLASATAWGQDVTVYGTSLFQVTKDPIPGLRTQTYAPWTQFVGVDANRLGHDGLSFHAFGWERVDLQDQSRVDGKDFGDISYGYLQYMAPEGNMLFKAGRFTVDGGSAIEQVDGGYAHLDLIGGFEVSAFGGQPVYFPTYAPASSPEYKYQRDSIWGTRLGKRFSGLGEVGVSYVQDGSTSARYLYDGGITPYDYTRRQVTADVHLTPIAALDFSGRTTVDVAPRLAASAGQPDDTSRIAEHDYALILKVSSLLSLRGTFTERHYQAYYAGTNLPTLFNVYELGAFHAVGLAATLGNPASWEATVDLRKTDRDSYGRATRVGGEVRHRVGETGILYGFGAHRVIADDRPIPGVLVTLYGLSYTEGRIWVMYGKDKFSASFDGIVEQFDNANNVAGRSSVHEMVASVGYQLTPAFKVSCDLSTGTTPTLDQQTVAMVRMDYRFGFSGKGAK